jgi:hypothetical protein
MVHRPACALAEATARTVRAFLQDDVARHIFDATH